MEDRGLDDDHRRHDVRIDDAAFPIVRATWPSETADDALDRYMAYVVERLRGGVRFAVVVDGRAAGGMTRAQHKRIGAMLDAHRALTSQHLVMSIVIASPLARMSLQAINALHPPPFPQRVFARVEDAVRWAELELASRPAPR